MNSVASNGVVALALATAVGGCGHQLLPGTRDFPLVSGSKLVECPAADRKQNPVCVSTPRDEAGEDIVRAYQRAIVERGFQLTYSAEIAVYTRVRNGQCDVILLGSPYLPPDERRTKIVLEFQHDRVSPKKCEPV